MIVNEAVTVSRPPRRWLRRGGHLADKASTSVEAMTIASNSAITCSGNWAHRVLSTQRW